MLYKIVGNTTSSRDNRSIISKVGNIKYSNKTKTTNFFFFLGRKMGLFISIIKIIEQLYNISSYGAFLGVTYCIRSHTQFLYTKGGHVSYSSMLQTCWLLSSFLYEFICKIATQLISLPIHVTRNDGPFLGK